MLGSKNRKKEEDNDGYKDPKENDVKCWSKQIQDVSKIRFQLSAATKKANPLKAIETYFEVLKHAFPKDIIERNEKVDIDLIPGVTNLKNGLELETLQGEDEGETVKWLNKVNGLFTEFAKISVNDASDKKKFVGELTKKCTRFNSLMKISPTYIGHKPLFKYNDVRAAFKKLGNTVASLPDLVKDDIK